MNEKLLAKIGQYEIYADGIVYDTENAQDIPEYVFIIRDVLIHQAKHGGESPSTWRIKCK